MDPAAAVGSSGIGETVFYALYGALLFLDPETKEIEPKIATELVPDDKALIWTLRLRDDVEFSDGTPFDAEAVKVNWERIADPETLSPNMGYASQIKTLSVVSPTELQITLNKANSGFDSLVAQRLSYIGSPTAIKKEGEDFYANPVGAGPFVLKDWVRDSSKTLKRNESYYDNPRPYLDELKILTLPDQGQGDTMMVAGQADCKVTWSSKSLTKVESQGLEAETVEVNGSPSLSLNTARAPFDDVRVRMAVAQALDTEQGADVTGTFIPAEPPLADDPDLRWPAPDVEGAQELFDEYAAENGDIEFTIGAFQDSDNQAEAEWIQAALNQFDHVHAEVEFDASATALSNVYGGNYQAHTWGNQIFTPADYYQYAHSESQQNVSSYDNPAVDEELDAALGTLHPEERLGHYRNVVEQLAEDVPFVVYGTRQASTIHVDTLHDVHLYNDGLILWDQVWTAK